LRARILVLYAILAILVSALLWATATTARENTDLAGQQHSSDLSKAVPSLLNYQGYLATADSGLVNETLAMTFRLFDSATKGAELWTETHSTVEVTNGQFYVLLGSVTSFPADLFDGQILYLQLEVGSEVFTPRKAIVSVAYSQMADEADHAATAGTSFYAVEAQHATYADTAAFVPGTSLWSVSGDNIYRLTGRVGIGIASPSAELEVIGTIDADAYTINGTALGTSDDSYWSEIGSDIYYMPGNVGVGTNTPTARLHVVDSKGHQGSLGGTDYGAYGQHSGGNYGHLGGSEYAVYGHNNNNNLGGLGASNYAVYGENYNGHWGGVGTSDYAVYGQHSGGNWGMIGSSFLGVYGYNSNGNYGSLGDNGYGVYAHHGNGNFGYLAGENYGAYGKNSTSGNLGYVGCSTSGLEGYASGINQGVLGMNTDSGHFGRLGTSMNAVSGFNDNDNFGSLADANNGAFGRNNNDNKGFLGNTNCGAMGIHNLGHTGKLGGSNYGAYGEHAGGNSGTLGTSGHGVYGSGVSSKGKSNYGVYGTVGNIMGYLAGPGGAVYGQDADAGNHGYIANDSYGVYGYSQHAAAVKGNHSSGNEGYIGNVNHGVYGANVNGNNGSLGDSDAGVKGNASSGYAGYFSGDVHVSGSVNKAACSFLIDHPLDPENKWLRHNCIESPEYLVMYRGKARFDGSGQSVVEMPEYFAALTKEDQASIHLTPVGRPFMTGAEWNSGFRSLTVYGEPNREVFWEVLAERDDPVIRQLTRPVEEDKIAEERGYYLHPEAFGLSDDRNVEWVRNPDMMRVKNAASETRQAPQKSKALPVEVLKWAPEPDSHQQGEEKSIHDLESRERTD